MTPQPTTHENEVHGPPAGDVRPPHVETNRPQPAHPTPNQRFGLAVLSFLFLVFAANIMAALAPAFSPIGAAIAFSALCLVVLGVNVVYNLEALRDRQ